MPCSVAWAAPCSSSETVTPAAVMSVPLPWSEKVSVPAPPSAMWLPVPTWTRSLPPPPARMSLPVTPGAVGAAPDPVVAAIAGQHVVEAGARDMLDADQRVVCPAAGGLGDAGDVEVDGDAGGRAGAVGGAVEAGAAVEHVVAEAAVEEVVAVAALERVVAAAAAQEVVAGIAGERRWRRRLPQGDSR